LDNTGLIQTKPKRKEAAVNNWYDVRLVQLKRQELDRELEQLKLLKQAGFADHVPTSFKPADKQTT
jgi:hypothetical protein